MLALPSPASTSGHSAAIQKRRPRHISPRLLRGTRLRRGNGVQSRFAGQTPEGRRRIRKPRKRFLEQGVPNYGYADRAKDEAERGGNTPRRGAGAIQRVPVLPEPDAGRVLPLAGADLGAVVEPLGRQPLALGPGRLRRG